jgi:hypothetical protein
MIAAAPSSSVTAPTSATTTYGNLVVHDFDGGADLASGPLVGPDHGAMALVGATDFASALAQAQQIKYLVDPGVQAIVDAGNGVIELRPLDQTGPAASLRSRSFGGGEITNPQHGLLGIYYYENVVPATT